MGTALKAEMTPPYDFQLERFKIKHPELANYVAELVGTYRTCQAEKIGSRRVQLEEAYEHIYVDDCPWCNRTMAVEKKSKHRLLAGG